MGSNDPGPSSVDEVCECPERTPGFGEDWERWKNTSSFGSAEAVSKLEGCPAERMSECQEERGREEGGISWEVTRCEEEWTGPSGESKLLRATLLFSWVSPWAG